MEVHGILLRTWTNNFMNNLGKLLVLRAVIVTAKLRGLNFEKPYSWALGGAVSRPVLAPFKVLN